MKRGYLTYFVVALTLCLIGLWAIVRIVDNANRRITALHAPEQVAPTAPTAGQIGAEVAAVSAAREAAEDRAAAAKASAEQAARLKKALEAVAVAPKPAPRTEPAHFYTPKGATPAGKVYSNASLKPAPKPVVRRADPGPARVIVDFKPSDANALEWQAAVASGRCAAFSFVNASGETVNRLYCDPVVVRPGSPRP